jgi:DnaJ-class molecular chaperone
MKEVKADFTEDACPACKGTGRLSETAEETREAVKRGIVSGLKNCPSCNGTGRLPKTR